jgi:hypothetical protein
MGLLKNQYLSVRFYSITCVFSVVGLLCIWVLPNTIALRHIFLSIGFLSALVIIVKSQFFSGRRLSEMLTILLFALLVLWALAHFIFFSLNPTLELSELKSIWVRAFVASIIAIGLSIALRVYKDLQPYFFVALFTVSVINLVAYLYLSYEKGNFLLPGDFVNEFIFKKIEAAFFGAITIAIACANIIFLMKEKIDIKKVIALTVWFLGVAIAIISSVVANTKNGVAIGLGLCALLGLTLMFKLISIQGKSKFSVIAPLFFVVLMLFGGWKVHNQFASQGWGTLIEDVQISSRLDEHNFWRFNSHDWPKVTEETFPINSRGLPVAGNTYERVAWATKGLSLIVKYPMGYGSINRSFVGMLNHAGVKQELDSQTHSGWIDFGLAYGVPGLLILSTLLFLILIKGLRSGDQFGLMSAWLVIGFIPFGVVAEINYKHNFEILLFFIAFAAASTIRIKNFNP